MASKRAPKMGAGAVIAIPLGDGRWVLSQIYRPGISFFLLVFDLISDGHDYPPQLTSPPIIGSWTNDAEVYRGEWNFLTHLPVAPGIFVEPEYKCPVNGMMTVESFDGNLRRPFVPTKDGALLNRHSQSPKMVEDAVKAVFGLEPWNPFYDKMILDPGVQPKNADR